MNWGKKRRKEALKKLVLEFEPQSVLRALPSNFLNDDVFAWGALSEKLNAQFKDLGSNPAHWKCFCSFLGCREVGDELDPDLMKWSKQLILGKARHFDHAYGTVISSVFF